MTERHQRSVSDISLIEMTLVSVLALSAAVVYDIAQVSIPGVETAAIAPYALGLSLAGLVFKAGIDASREQKDSGGRYPAPEYDRPGVPYHCSECGEWVEPDDETPESGLVIGGGTYKLCPECAREIRERFEDLADGEEGSR